MGSRVFWVTALVFSALSCQDSGEPPLVAEEILQLNPEASQVVFNMQHHMDSEGVRRAYVEADTAYYLENQSLVELRVLKVTFYDSNGAEASILTSKEGRYDWGTGDMIAKVDVVVQNSKGERIETTVLNYNRIRDRLWSEEPTRMMYADGTIIEGTAFESDSRMEVIELTSATMVRPGSQQPEREP
jgi:LPS export ABC transporter protein LptC